MRRRKEDARHLDLPAAARQILIVALASAFVLHCTSPASAADTDVPADSNAAKAALTPDRTEAEARSCGHVVVIESADEEGNAGEPSDPADTETADESKRGQIGRFWLDGELEYRYEELRRAGLDTEYDRDIALLLGANLELADDWRLRAALRSSRSGRPLTNWVNTGDLDDQRWLSVREYWLRKDLDTGRGQNLRLQGGRFTYPFELTQLAIDNDLYLSGGYAQYRWEPNRGDLDRLRLSVLGAQLLGGCAGSGPARLLSARADSRWELAKSASWQAAVSYHGFTNADMIGAAVAKGDWDVGGPTATGLTTNAVVDGNPANPLVSDFHLADLWVRVELAGDPKWPAELECEYVHNLGARGVGRSEADAVYTGIAVGRRGDPGDWQFSVEHAIVEQDAVLAAVNRGEYATNYEGTELEARYCPFAGVEWRLAYTLSHNLKDLTPGFAFDERELRLYVSYSW